MSIGRTSAADRFEVGALGFRSDAASLGGDTTVVHPLAGGVGARYFEVSLSDSSSLRLHSVQSTFRIEPSAGMPPYLCRSFLRCPDDECTKRSGALRSVRQPCRYERYAGGSSVDSARRRLLLDSLQGVYPAVAAGIPCSLTGAAQRRRRYRWPFRTISPGRISICGSTGRSRDVAPLGCERFGEGCGRARRYALFPASEPVASGGYALYDE